MPGSTISLRENKRMAAPFDMADFLAFAKTYWPNLDTADQWIRSGRYIAPEFKDFFASYRLLGSYTPAGPESRCEVLLLRPQPGVGLDLLEAPANKLARRHMEESGVGNVLAAFPSGEDEAWGYLLLAAETAGGVTIPQDVLRFLCRGAVKQYLRARCALSDAVLDGYFSAFNFLYDDLPIQQNAGAIDKALAEIKVCDTAANRLQILAAMAAEISALRDGLSRYLASRHPRTLQTLEQVFWLHSAYATDLDSAALDSLGGQVRAKLPEDAELDAAHFAKGSILHEKLFDVPFDVVIANPPHVRQEKFSQIKGTLADYEVFHKGADLYCYYIERAFSLLAQDGAFALLTSNRWLRSDYGAPLRKFLAGKNLTDLVDYGNLPVLSGVVTPMSVLVGTNAAPSPKLRVTLVSDRTFGDLQEVVEDSSFAFARARLDEKPWTFEEDSVEAVMRKIEENATPLEAYVDGGIYRGILTGLNEAFVLEKKEAEEILRVEPSAREILRPFLGGRNVKRYATPTVKKYLIFVPRGFTDRMRNGAEPWPWFAAKYPAVAKHLALHKEKAEKRKDKGDYWWELRSCKYYDAFEKTKIIFPAIVSRVSATLDGSGLFSNDKTSIICCGDFYLLGLLNSRLMDFYARRITTELLNGYFELKPANLAALPIRRISETNGFQRKLRDQVREAAERLAQLYAKPKGERGEAEEDEIVQQEKKLNRTVYKIYRLTPGEISIVENN